MQNNLIYDKKEFLIQVTETSIKPINSEKFIGISKNAFKIYVIKNQNDFLYVGITKTYISSRFMLGFNATKKVGNNGYHGYQWVNMHKGKELKLIVFSFPNMIKNETEERQTIESIEAELVFQIRSKYNKWPECQNEIHFYNKGNEIVKFAEKLFEEIL